MNNSWLNSNKRNIEQIKRIMVEAEYRPEFQSLPLRTIQQVLNGAEAEILRLQKELEQKK
jgi:hypothetical protein